jgi:hypothetical protein
MVAPMAITTRVERLERERRFKDWLQFERYLEFLTDEQLAVFAILGFWPDPPPPEPPPGACRLDSRPLKELVRLFEVDERKFTCRSNDEKEFFCVQGHWPEQICETSYCQKPWSDKLRAHYSRTTGTEGANVTWISRLRQDSGAS